LISAKLRIFFVAFITTLLFASGLEAQQAKEAASAPIPKQILSAKKVFISNAGAERNEWGDLTFTGGPDRPYNQFYTAIETSGKYELVLAPADADLVFEIGLIGVRRAVLYDELKLVLRDPKTNTILWSFVEHASAVGRQKSRDGAFDRAIGVLVDDLRKLGTQSTADDNNR
jgi:hypothetical protein